MSLSKVDAHPSVLNIASLSADVVYTKCALLTGHSSGMDRNSRGFYKVFLKDAEGYSITGMIFNVDMYLMKGVTLSSLKGKFVHITFVVNIYMGQKNLIITSIRLYEGPIDFDLDKMIGAVEGHYDMARDMSKFLSERLGSEVTLSSDLHRKTYQSLADGRIGGLCLLLALTLEGIKPARLLLDEKDMASLWYTFLIFAKICSTIYDCLAQFDSIPRSEMVAVLKRVNNIAVPVEEEALIKEHAESLIVAVCMNELPDTKVSRIIYRSYVSALGVITEHYALHKVPTLGLSYINGGEMRNL